MSAELTVLQNGFAGFARQTGSQKAWWEGWNGLEANLVDPNAPIEEWMRASGTDFEVTLRDLSYTFDNEYGWTINHLSKLSRALVRTDTQKELATVGMQYHAIQNEQLFSIMRDYIDADIAEVSTIGSLKDGKAVYLLGEIKDGSYFLPGGDAMQTYLLLVAHHGTGACGVYLTSVRVVCQNTLSAALNGNSGLIRIQHRSELTDEKLEQLKMDAGITIEQIAQRRANQMLLARTPVTEKWVQDYFITLLGKPAKAIDDQPKAVTNTMDLFNGQGVGSDLASARGTVWGALNAVTEWVDHGRGTEKSRQFQALIGQGAVIKNRAYETAIEYAKAA